MLAEFELQGDKIQVVRDGPWIFDKNLILVSNFDDLQQVRDIKMVEAAFWIQVYDLPFLARNEYIRNFIGNALGRVKEIDMVPREVEWGEYMRIRVTLDITKMLLRRNKLNISLHEPMWVKFKYECLLDFCFCCGVLSHNHKECRVWLTTPELYQQDGLP